MMKAVIQIFRDAFIDIWTDLWTMLVCNLFWLIATVLIIPGPPATLALIYLGNRIAHGEIVDLSDFWGAFRRNWGPAWRWGGIYLVVILILVADFAMTGKIQSPARNYIQGLYLTLLAFWPAIQFFVLPFLFEQERMTILQALRNGFTMIGKNPGFALVFTALLTLTLIASTFVFLLSMMLGAAFSSIVGNRAVLNRLEIARQSSQVA